MPQDQPLPHIWLISDERNDAGLERALARLPRGSGFIFRHYHLDGPQRWERFRQLRHIARARQQKIILADSAQTAREWGAHGIYGAPRTLYPRRSDMLQLATAHGMRELGEAQRFGADAVLLSPVFSTNSHPGEPSLGPAAFRLLARQSTVPVIALGGMNAHRAATLRWPRWAAIDGLS